MTVRKRNGSAVGRVFRHVVELTPAGDAWRFWLVMIVLFVASFGFGFYLGFRGAVTGSVVIVDQPTGFMAFVVFFTALYLTLTWVAMLRCSANQLRDWVAFQQERRSLWRRVELVMVGKRVFGGMTGFLTLVTYSVFGLMSAIFLLPAFRSGLDVPESAWMYVASGSGVVVFWAILHTAFAFQYATLYYRPGVSGGFDFPGADVEPGIVDFAYFAFTIGTSFAASDVSVTSTRTRKVVLIHTVLSFFYNTAILALVINILLSAL